MTENKSRKSMFGLCFEGQWRWTQHFLLVFWLWVVVAALPTVLGFFLGDSKAVLSGCADHWTLQNRAAMPLLFQMTVCVHVRVVVPGAWAAFSYSSVHAPRPDLGLEGDEGALYGWLLGVRHRFPLRLSPTHWHKVCLRRDVQGNSFSLEVDGEVVAQRTVIARAITPSGSLWLGCRPRDRPPGAMLGEVELYLFRVWADLGSHAPCEDGSVIGWDSRFWGVTSAKARQRDPNLLCALSENQDPSQFHNLLENPAAVREGPRLCDCTAFCSDAVAKETTTSNQDELEEESEELLYQTLDASQLNSSQVAQVVGNLEKLLEGPTVSKSVGQRAINIISSLMEGDSSALSASANRLIRTVDGLGLKLVVADESEVLTADSLILAVRTVDGTNFPATSVNILNNAGLQLNILSRFQSRSSETIVGSVFLPSSLTEGLSPEEKRRASRVQFSFYTTTSLFQDIALGNQTLVSPVLGVSVANLTIGNLSENIEFTIRNTDPLHVNYEASCAFWDFTLNGGGGGWNTTGCFVINTTQENTTCSCNHLTSFAILLDVSRGGLPGSQHAIILTYITYIGCGISAIFVAVTLLTYISFPKLLRDIPSKILVQLCLSLFFLNLLFLLDGWLALFQATGLCISTAFFLHYFLLTSFTWAGLEALHMYLSIVQVFTPYLSRYMLKFSLLGWGLPFIVVIIVISVDKDNYGLVTYGKSTNGTSDDFCWLRNDIAFYIGVVAYFILIFALSLLVFIVVLVQLARIKRQNPQNQSPQRGLMTDLRSITGLIILLGLTWGFALFAWGPLYLPFVYLFSIFNSLQGFFIFVFHCAVKENVRRQWRTYLCCGSLRLAENSEWSRTATQNPNKLSVTTATSSALNPLSRSSSVISDGTNSSGSVFADSGISDGSHGDVVLNEFHRRNTVTLDLA
ncbi:adhesion G-protein coupled receptor G2 [Diretmus argenteus]